jgi:hypothetical protein
MHIVGAVSTGAIDDMPLIPLKFNKYDSLDLKPTRNLSNLNCSASAICEFGH